ncbi:hypothetical protein ISN44_As09g005520 [Arabidopsis suecica]|uniref:Uncharacterized protein n=1 Tax=Arabidopsis suecica TaxID=45249 RepID=A0A8T2AGM9_ARASU|nr:hypothetical protein ISN44_As09g005520 [Arabidopsis suecica]
MDVRRSPFIFIAVSIIAMFLITGVRSQPIRDICPGVCHAGIEPDCDTLCTSLGFTGGYCQGLTCCCNPKSSKSSITPPI